MLFHFKIDKTMQAIAALLHFHGTKEMSYLRMLKILYIADRESLKETGRPITGDRIVALEHGPVLSGVYDLLRGEHTAWPVWSEFFQKNGYRIVLINDPGNGKLSKYEIGKLHLQIESGGPRSGTTRRDIHARPIASPGRGQAHRNHAACCTRGPHGRM